MNVSWPHAPGRWQFEPGIYMVTGRTYNKVHHLNTPERRDYFLESFLQTLSDYGWSLQAWAIMANHYHFVAASPENPRTLKPMLGKLHMTAAKQLNIWDNTPGRKVWYQYRETALTFEKSYLARLNYVHYNPAHHGVIPNAENYPWCSATWFGQNATSAFVATVKGLKIDSISEQDEPL